MQVQTRARQSRTSLRSMELVNAVTYVRRLVLRTITCYALYNTLHLIHKSQWLPTCALLEWTM